MLKRTRAKLAGRHSSLTKPAEEIVRAIHALACVSKIVPGVISPTKGPAAAKSIKISDIPAGIRVRVRGPKSVQELFVYTDNRPLTSEKIAAAFKD